MGLLVHTIQQSVAGASVTTGNIDTTGCASLFAFVNNYVAEVPATLTDSKGNTWVPLTTRTSTTMRVTLYSCISSPVVGTGHNFTANQTGTGYPSIAVMGFSDTVLAFDVENWNSNVASTIAAGSVTPVTNSEIIIAALGSLSNTLGFAVDSGFTISDQDPFGSAQHFGTVFAYLIQGALATVNPVFSVNTPIENLAVIAAFRTQPLPMTGTAITDIRAYSTLETDNLPRFLVRNSANQIFVDSGQVGTLSGTSQGACMIPYRPNQSPQSWMYVAAAEDYKKYSAPDIVTGGVIEYEVGIEEQQNSPDAAPNQPEFVDFSGVASDWTQGGTAIAPIDLVRTATTGAPVLIDPASGTGANSFGSAGLPVGSAELMLYMNVVADLVTPSIIQQIYPALNGGESVAIVSIFYFSGTTGRCVIVPTQGATDTAFQSSQDQPPIGAPVTMSALRRGSLVDLSGGSGAEVVLVLSATNGPNGTICFECETTLNFVPGDTINGRAAVGLSGLAAALGVGLTASCLFYIQFGKGIGTMSRNFGTFRPFAQVGSNSNTTQQYDYLGFGININDLSRLVAVTIIFNVDPTVTFDQNAYYLVLTPADFVNHASSMGLTPASTFTQFFIPISRLIRIGGASGFTLSDTNGIQVKIETTESVNVSIGPFYVTLGFQPDCGTTGTPYRYLVRSRNSITGAVSNPSPTTRYGVYARRQSIRVTMQDTNSDIQDNIWDVYREGGAVNTYRYIGSTPNTGGLDTFKDDYFDTAALGGSVVEYDNFQPWPTIDIPFVVTAGGFSGVTVTIQVTGTIILVTYYSASVFVDPAPATILRWLPGTLVTLDGLNAYTLRNRPTLITLSTPPAAHYFAYMFEIVENAGSASPQTLNINEPNIANQDLPYLWGPDAEGTVFGAGDPFRPGNVYFCKSFNPDSAPDQYNQELTNPSEPLMGGEVINGLALVASTKRWWALYPNFGSGLRYQAVEAPVRRGLIAPYAHATDGQVIYFWAKDGIWSTLGQSLTDGDLHNIFPHEGVPGRNYTYGGKTVYAPDYKYASMFRLCYRSSYLYADYRDSTGLPRTLVCDLRDGANPAWCVDEYADPIGVHYGVEQQAGTLLSDGTIYSALVMGDDNGLVHVQRDLVNDNGTPITGIVATAEFNGGDVRSNALYNDQFLDLVPAAVAGVDATILEGGSAAQAVKTIPTAIVRTQTNVPIGLELQYMGVLLEWIDDFDLQSIPTLLRSWQPMLQSVPVSLFLWKNQGTAFNLPGYKHMPRILFAYKSTAPVTLTITVYDGTAPAVVTLPSTGGAYRKTLFWLTPNKGMLYFVQASCADAEWQPYLTDCEFYVGAWERDAGYTLVKDIQTALGVGDS